MSESIVNVSNLIISLPPPKPSREPLLAGRRVKFTPVSPEVLPPDTILRGGYGIITSINVMERHSTGMRSGELTKGK